MTVRLLGFRIMGSTAFAEERARLEEVFRPVLLLVALASLELLVGAFFLLLLGVVVEVVPFAEAAASVFSFEVSTAAATAEAFLAAARCPLGMVVRP